MVPIFSSECARIAARITSAILVVALGICPLLAYPLEFSNEGGITAKIGATVTVGTAIRTEAPDRSVLGAVSGARNGGEAGQLSLNTGGNNLNFRKNRPVSTVLKATVDLDLKWRDAGLFARARAWYDDELKNGARAYGNFPNGFTANVPLSDSGFDPAARFNNVLLADLYAYGKLRLGETATLDARLGRQSLNWGASRYVSGGINVVNASDVPAQVRPGALPEESRVPTGMLHADYSSGAGWGVDAFVQYEFRPSVPAPCGVFFATSSLSPAGCNYVAVVGGLDDPTALASNRYVHRAADVKARDSGQYGASLRYEIKEIGTWIRAYTMNYHSRAPFVRVINGNVAGGYGIAGSTQLTDPDGLKYALHYPEDIRLHGLSFDTRADSGLRIFGETTLRPSQPLGHNGSDLVRAFVTRPANSVLNLARNTNAIPPGGSFDAYDRYKVLTASLAASKAWSGVAGARSIGLTGELGWSQVRGLPDPGVMRYGRSDSYGVAASSGQACVDTSAAQKACSHEGLISRTAWGYRVNLSAVYPGAFLGAALLPSLTYANDVSGYSYDGGFLKGRKSLQSGMRAEWGKDYFAQVQYTRQWGGAYNLRVDGDFLSLALGANF